MRNVTAQHIRMDVKQVTVEAMNRRQPERMCSKKRKAIRRNEKAGAPTPKLMREEKENGRGMGKHVKRRGTQSGRCTYHSRVRPILSNVQRLEFLLLQNCSEGCEYDQGNRIRDTRWQAGPAGGTKQRKTKGDETRGSRSKEVCERNTTRIRRATGWSR